MLRRALFSNVMLGCAAALAGCAPAPVVHPSDGSSNARHAGGDSRGVDARGRDARGTGATQADARAAGALAAEDDVQVVMQLGFYELSVPFGAVSKSEQFWRHIDEDAIDLPTHQLLQESGVRVGIGPDAEWSYFKDLIEKYGATVKKGNTKAARSDTLELPVRTNVDEQNIFYFNSAGVLIGRSYANCDNLFCVAYEPCPRKPGVARLDVCALVRGVRKEFEVSIRNDIRDIQYRCPEYLYDLRLRQDVPMGHFLVIAPSAQASLPDTLGHAFLVRPGPAEPRETVLLLVPHPFRLRPQAEYIQPDAAAAVESTSPSTTPRGAGSGQGSGFFDLPKLRTEKRD
ncbi:MAG TPA: hypothetical protein VFC78_10495 [Tepidisphaeraceae bacterium]|nr:hypothetical protein [Tepidisphaeraceae bacterium]